MGIVDDKRGIFTEIGALNSATSGVELPNSTNSISSVNNSKEIVPFMLDMLSVLLGSETLKQTTGELMTDFIRNVEPELKDELKSQFIDFNSDQSLPSSITTTGIRVNASELDSFKTIATDPNTDVGNLVYGGNTQTFDSKCREAIVVEGTEVTYENITIEYDSASDIFIFRSVNNSQTIGQFFTELIDGLTLILEAAFIAKIMDILFGTISNSQGKNQQQAILEDKINKTIEKIINEEEDITITDQELREIEETARKREEGIQELDVGCSVLQSNLSLENLTTLVDTTTVSNDPLTVGNAYVTALDSSFDIDDSRSEENDQPIKDGFFKRLINAIVGALVAAVTVSPQIRMLFAISYSFKNNTDTGGIGDPIDDLQERRGLADCLSKKAKSTINEFIFNLVKRALIDLIVPVVKLIVREKINQFIGILRSLI